MNEPTLDAEFTVIGVYCHTCEIWGEEPVTQASFADFQERHKDHRLGCDARCESPERFKGHEMHMEFSTDRQVREQEQHGSTKHD